MCREPGQGTATLYLQVFLVVVVHDSQEDGHEDVSVDEDVENEEGCEDEAGAVGRHPAGKRREQSGRYTKTRPSVHFLPKA